MLARTMMMIIGSFLVCWLPYTIRIFLEFVTNQDHLFEDKFYALYGNTGRYAGKVLRSVTYHFTILNTLFDPFIYYFRMKDLQESVSSMLSCKNKRNSEKSSVLDTKTCNSEIKNTEV